MIVQRKLSRKALYKGFKLPRGHSFFSEPTHVSIHMYSSSSQLTLYLFLAHHLLSVSMWKFISIQLMGQGLITGHWSLVV